jgi:hypothetical protein
MNLLTLHGRNELAGEASQEPLAPVEALGEGGRDADHTHGDAGYSQVHYVQVLRCPVVFLTFKFVKYSCETGKARLGLAFRRLWISKAINFALILIRFLSNL